MTKDGPRGHREYTGREVVLALARHGIATSTIARALMLSPEQVVAWCRSAHAVGYLLRMPPDAPEDGRGALATEIVHLRDQLATTREQLRELRANLDGEAPLSGVAGLTTKEAVVVAELLRHGRASKQRLYHALYGDLPDPDQAPEPKIIDVFVCKARPKLAARGISIGTQWGWGYFLEPADQVRLRALAAEPITRKSAA